MSLTVTVDSELLRSECLPCQWCGAEIDYDAEPGSSRSFVMQNNQASHYSCAAAHSTAAGGRGGTRGY